MSAISLVLASTIPLRRLKSQKVERETQEELQVLLENIPGLFCSKVDFVFFHCNPCLCRLKSKNGITWKDCVIHISFTKMFFKPCFLSLASLNFIITKTAFCHEIKNIHTGSKIQKLQCFNHPVTFFGVL